MGRQTGSSAQAAWSSSGQSTEMWLILFQYYMFYLKVREREKQRHKEVFHPLVHSLSGHNGQHWIRPKPAIRSIIWVSQADVGTQALCPSSAATPGSLADSWMESGAGGTPTSPVWDDITTVGGFIHFATVPAQKC